MNELLFENSAWKMFRTHGGKRVKIMSKTGLGTATAYLVGKEFNYGAMEMFQRAPRIAYTNETIVPAYMRDKVTQFFSRGRAYR